MLAVLFFRSVAADAWFDLAGNDRAPGTDERWRVVNYWALWCTPCRAEVPELNSLHNDHVDLRVLGVNFDQPVSLEAARTARDSLGIEFPVLRRSPHAHYAQPMPPGLPATDLLDPEGRFRMRLLGPQTAAGLAEWIEKLKAEAEGE